VAKTSQKPMWWADKGPDHCAFCSTTYYAETGYYCAHCDRGVCTSCVVVMSARKLVLCPECSATTNIHEGDKR
jgi:hypothetical protein